MLCENEEQIRTDTLPRKPSRIAHTPNTAYRIPKKKPAHTVELNPPKQAKKHESRAPSQSTIEPKYCKYDIQSDIDMLLTPPSVSSVDDIDDTKENQNHVSAIIEAIVSWDAEKILDKMYLNRAFMTNVQPVPRKSFTDFQNHER